MSVFVFPLGPLSTNSHLLASSDGKAVAIDVGGDPEPMLAHIREHGLVLTDILLTHLHFDHTYGVAALAKATGATVRIPPHDRCLLQDESGRGGMWGFPLVPEYDGQDLEKGDHVFAGMRCTVLDTPGHTPGGVSLHFPDEGCVFSGDALFRRSIGRTDFPGGDHELLLRSLRMLLESLPGDLTVYPGHGPTTTIGEEKLSNPFCGDFAQ